MPKAEAASECAELNWCGNSSARPDDAHAASAAAGNCLDDDREADLLRPFLSLFLGIDDTVGAGKNGHSVSLHGLTRPVLLAHGADDLRGRPDELETGGFADVREICVFAQQSVTGMNGIDIGDFGGTDDGRNVEVAFSGARRSDTKRFIGKADVK